MVLLIDANILLDVLCNRQEFVKESSLVWKMCETKQAKGYVSTLTIANLVYIMRKELDAKKIEEVIARLRMIFEFTELSVTDILIASKMEWEDYEDAIQTVTAQRIHANHIITRNVKDFVDSTITALSPKEFLSISNNGS